MLSKRKSRASAPPRPGLSTSHLSSTIKLANGIGGDSGGSGEKEKGKISRQSYSCAECKRLKLKCSRSWPCTSCEKRGCGQICPVGIIRTGKGGKRLILAETEELHQRISTLELALAASQARHSTQPHPLLEDAYLFSPRDPARPRASASGHAVDADSASVLGHVEEGDAIDGSKQEAGDEEDVVDSAFGTLTIGRSGESRFVGSFAGSEYLRTDHLPDDSNVTKKGRRAGESGLATPPPTAALNSSFDLRLHTARTGPIAPGLRIGGYADGRDVDIVQLRQELPDWEKKGRELVQNCWENVSWMHPIVPQNVFDTQYLQLAYDTQRAIHPHQLAVVYLVMALGVMFDLHRPAFDNRAAELFALGQSCLSAIGFEHATPSTVRALLLCGTYLLNDKHGSGAEIYWPVLGTAIKVAYSLGLHRDGSVFGLSVEETEERRLIWWELITSDRLLATAFARPAGIASRTTDTKMPSVSGAEGDDYQRTRFRIAELMEKINNVQTQLAAVPHTLIKALDAELVEFKKSIPDSLLPSTPIPSLPMDSTISPQLVYHRLTIRLLLAQCRLLLNRPFFARALSENHEDPSFCKHGEPFCALFGAALEIVQVVQQMVVYHPSLVARWWVYWFHAFSSACCFAAIAIRAPKSAFAAPAFDGLTTVLDLATAAPPGCRAKKGLAVLLRLRARAQDSMRKASRQGAINASYRQNMPGRLAPYVPSEAALARERDGGEEDDLGHLAGRSKLRRVKVKVKESHIRSRSDGSAERGSGDAEAGGSGAYHEHQRGMSGDQQYDSSPARYTLPGSDAGGGMYSGVVAPGAYGGGGGSGRSRAGTGNFQDFMVSPSSVISAATTLADRPWEGVVPPPPPPMSNFGEEAMGAGMMGDGTDARWAVNLYDYNQPMSAIGAPFPTLLSGSAVAPNQYMPFGSELQQYPHQNALWSPPGTDFSPSSSHFPNNGSHNLGMAYDFTFSAPRQVQAEAHQYQYQPVFGHYQPGEASGSGGQGEWQGQGQGQEQEQQGALQGQGVMDFDRELGLGIGMDLDMDMSMALGFGEGSGTNAGDWDWESLLNGTGGYN